MVSTVILSLYTDKEKWKKSSTLTMSVLKSITNSSTKLFCYMNIARVFFRLW